MYSRIVAAVIGLLLPGAAWCQDELIKDFSNEHLEKFIKNDLMKEFVLDKVLGYDIKGTPYYAYLNPAKVLLFVAYKTNDPEKPVTEEALNAWNKKANYTRAYFVAPDKKRIQIESWVDTSAGVTIGQLKSLYSKFDAEVKLLLADIDQPKTAQENKQSKAEVLRQGFPHDNAKSETLDLAKHDSGWEIEWDFVPFSIPGNKRDFYFFRIATATFRWKDSVGAPKSLVVLRNLYLAEAFTQYDDRSTCFLDLAKVGIPHVPAHEKYLGPTCVGAGRVLPSANPEFQNKVHKELHYDGLRWMSIYGDPKDRFRARKGEKLILWSAIHSGNYAYLMEYHFTDDGRIVARLGFTAHNFFDREKIAKKRNPYSHRTDDGDVHPHIGCWRFDFDLSDPDRKIGGPAHNELSIVRRVFDPQKITYEYDDFRPRYDAKGAQIKSEVKGGFAIKSTPFPGDAGQKEAREGKAKWVAEEFTTLRAESSAIKSDKDKKLGYDLISTRTGTASKLVGNLMNAAGLNIDFANYDFWVTKTPVDLKHYHDVPELAAKQNKITGQPSTIWHSVAGLHVPRNEDFAPGGTDAYGGVALTEWISFTLRPRNLFDGTPFYSAPKQ